MISFAEAPQPEAPSAVSLVNALLRVMEKARAKFRTEFNVPTETPVFCVLDTKGRQAECRLGGLTQTYDFTELK